MKINIIGFSGSGKSTLARNLSEHYGLPVQYMDRIFWLPGWQMRPREEQTAIMQQFLDEHPDGWVIDGNYTKNLYNERLAAADSIIFLNFNRFLCLYRILRRNIVYKNKSRFSMTEGCDEKIDWPFIRWAFWDARTPKAMKKFQELQRQYPEKFHNIRSPRQLERYLQSLDPPFSGSSCP